ncbi:hypothetical protein GCM10011612_03950 [Actinomyces gaoshouyii]|uniref:Uncharacterized protein n=1 Tax=Actinomyces gaoshouyii TaxID=1960083 RepID=A0A8H9H721_9ACTO|nr:hypothetical protein GCM10011612_03950 [Actinomyces gaoshouyii]
MAEARATVSRVRMTSSPTGSSVKARIVRCARSASMVALRTGAVIGSRSARGAVDAEGAAEGTDDSAGRGIAGLMSRA